MQTTPEWIFVVFTAATALGALLQACVLIGMFVVMMKAIKKFESIAKIAEEHAIPLMRTSRNLLEEVSPKLKVAAQNVMEISEKAKVQAAHVNTTVDDLVKKTETQADRVDEMITGTLNTLTHATATLQRAVTAPVRQVGAVLTGIRAGFDVLRTKERESHATADGDHFV